MPSFSFSDLYDGHLGVVEVCNYSSMEQSQVAKSVAKELEADGAYEEELEADEA